MCKRLFKALKIKMDNFKLRYELAGATETIEVLRKQLDEKDEQLNDWEDGIIICERTDAENKVKELEQQLAEKEEFLKKQKELFETVDRELYLTKDTLKHHTNIYNSLVESKDQDKIEFAMTELEKARKTILNIQKNKDGFISTMIDLYDFNETIDNQIAELKKEMK